MNEMKEELNEWNGWIKWMDEMMEGSMIEGNHGSFALAKFQLQEDSLEKKIANQKSNTRDRYIWSVVLVVVVVVVLKVVVVVVL